MPDWIAKRILIVVRTYPVPARKGIEVSCTAGITDDGEWIRLFPVPYRFLDDDRRFTKYQWVNVQVTKARTDPRPESFTPNLDTLTIGEVISTADNWRARREITRPLMRPSLCSIQRERDANGSPTLGIFKPAQIAKLVIDKAEEAAWTEEQMNILRQIPMFSTAPPQELEKLPFDFRYQFRCMDESCPGHNLTCFDWEMGQAYRSWRRQYGNDWERAFRQRFEDDMINRNDTHFFVGNLHQFPTSWIVVGLFYPPRPASPDLFDQLAKQATAQIKIGH
jgi:hypothetical protein